MRAEVKARQEILHALRDAHLSWNERFHHANINRNISVLLTIIAN
jgi:hypothetical protein